MAGYIGKDGDIWVNTTSSTSASTALGMMDTWTLTPSIEVVDITAYGSSSRDRAQTLRDWTVEASGTLDRSKAQQAELLAIVESGGGLMDIAVKLYATTSRSTKYWGGNGLLTGCSVVSSIADKVSVSFSLSGNGALSWTGA